MSWRDALAPMAGPLLGAAERFLLEHPGAPSPAPAGVEGLRSLAEAIDAWAERVEVTSEEDERFVEGAGALLALLLLDHLGRGAHLSDGHVHRLRVGERGFFDPFGAIDRALEEEDARATLVREVARAEGEAAEREGVGRAMRLLEARLGSRRVERAFGPQVTLTDGIELDLGRVLRATEGEPDAACAKAIDKLVAMLPGAGGADPGTPWEEARERLLPRLSKPGFAGVRGARLATRPVFGGLLELALVLAYDGRSRFVRTDELDAWGCEHDRAVAQAVANLARRSAVARFGTIETTHGPLVVARTGDALDSARLLLPTLHDVLSSHLGTPFFCGVPHRDALYAGPSGSGALREALHARVRDDFARAPHPASDALFLVDARGPRPA